MSALNTGKVKSSSLKQGAKARNIKGKQINYRTGKTKSARVQKVRPISAYTKKYNTKRVYLYSMMTKAEKMKIYDKERRAMLREVKKLEFYGLDAEREAIMKFSPNAGKYVGQIPTSKQQEWMSQTYGGIGAFRGKQEIEEMIAYKEYLKQLRKEIESELPVDPIERAFLLVKTKLEVILEVEAQQGKWRSGTGSYKSLDAAKAEQLLKQIEDLEHRSNSEKQEFADNVFKNWGSIQKELDDYIYNLYESYDTESGKSNTAYLQLIEQLLPRKSATIDRLMGEIQNEKTKGWYAQ